MVEKVTLSVIKADVGGYVGHSSIHPVLLEEAQRHLEAAKRDGIIVDFHVTRVGDDLELIMTHRKGVDDPGIHHLAWRTFEECTRVAKSLKLYGAGQDLLSEAFSGNVKGMGPGVAEMEFIERESEPILIFMADKTSAGAWNMPLYKMFADPFNTAGWSSLPKCTRVLALKCMMSKSTSALFSIALKKSMIYCCSSGLPAVISSRRSTTKEQAKSAPCLPPNAWLS